MLPLKTTWFGNSNPHEYRENNFVFLQQQFFDCEYVFNTRNKTIYV